MRETALRVEKINSRTTKTSNRQLLVVCSTGSHLVIVRGQKPPQMDNQECRLQRSQTNQYLFYSFSNPHPLKNTLFGTLVQFELHLIKTGNRSSVKSNYCKTIS